MRFRDPFISTCLALSLLGATACSVPLEQRTQADTAMDFNQERLALLDETLQGYVDRGELPGVSVLIARHGRIAHLKVFGFADIEAGTPLQNDTLMRIYSMSKPITAAAVMAALEDGNFALDDPVMQYVPELVNLRVYQDQLDGQPQTVPTDHKMTIADLLMHTAGFTMSFQASTPVSQLYQEAGLRSATWFLDGTIPDLGAFAARLGEIPLAYQPGERWHYGLGLDVAALIVERTSGQDFDQFLQTRFFVPLQMGDTGFHVPDTAKERFSSLYARVPDAGLSAIETASHSAFLRQPAVATGSGGLVSTLMDYFHFAQMLCNGGELDGVRVLREESVNLMLTNHLRDDQLGQLAEATGFGFGGSDAGMGFGYGGAVITADERPDKGTYMWGGAASTTFLVDRRNGVVAVLMTQLMPSGTYPLGDILRTAVYEALSPETR